MVHPTSAHRPPTTAFARGAFLTLLLALSCVHGYGTHLRAGEISVVAVDCATRTFEITITAYIDLESRAMFGGDQLLRFGDGNSIAVPATPAIPRPDLGAGIGVAQFVVRHTYSEDGSYLINFDQPFRNIEVMNMANSAGTRFYVETRIVIDARIGCNSAPQLQVPPVDQACAGQAWFHNGGAYDADGDTLSYELAIPQSTEGNSVPGYSSPTSPEFAAVAGINYQTANEAQNGPPVFFIDPSTGTITWDAPMAQGEYNIAFKVIQWRRTKIGWQQVGHVIRDMQILVNDCPNNRPRILELASLCVEVGETVSVPVIGFDPDGDSVRIEAFSNLFSANPAMALVPGPATGLEVKYQPSGPSAYAEKNLVWTAGCSHVRREPYQVFLKITDKPASGRPLPSFAVLNITVVGPAPQWESVAPLTSINTVKLEWTDYACASATSMQIWRRVESYAYNNPDCVVGMPGFLGYTLVDVVPISQNSYFDDNKGKGLATGAQYCYRLVAVFPGVNGGESYVSDDRCVLGDWPVAPVITNVSVSDTDPLNGKVVVKWRSILGLGVEKPQPPYSFEVYRVVESGNRLEKAHAGRLSDSTFVDMDVDTERRRHQYRVVQFDHLNRPSDTSFVASSVWLETKPEGKHVRLQWSADVPWSIRTDDFPAHLVFRAGGSDMEQSLQLIDSASVTIENLRYLDDGRYNNQPLVETEMYCYRVLTKGSYGNARIAVPLLNYSQVSCVKISDDRPPCTPTFDSQMTTVNCGELLDTTGCGEVAYSNTLRWNRPTDPVCAADVRSYTIYAADKRGSAFTKYAENVRDTFFIDANEGMKSFARCYKIVAVDLSGNESDFSEEFCFDNCPNYQLPNVFTPGGDMCNNLFSAFSDRIRAGVGEGVCGQEEPRGCARFVRSVVFKVYNRWGRHVYDYDSSNDGNIYIDWDGRDATGVELPQGTYFYTAEVTFDVVDPARATQTLKGWVQILR